MSNGPIAHVVEAFGGGVRQYMRLVLPGLVRRGFDIHLYCSPREGSGRFAQDVAFLRGAGVRVRILRMTRRIAPLRDALGLVALTGGLSRDACRLVHTHGSKAGALGRLAAKRLGIPAVHTPHCFSFLRAGDPVRRKVYLWVERLLGAMTARLLAVSESEARTAWECGIVPPDRCVTVHNGLPCLAPSAGAECSGLADMRRELGILPGDRIVLSACRLVAYKGVMRLLEAARLSRSGGVCFVLAGEGPLRRRAERFVRRHGLSSKVRLPGDLPDVEALLCGCDVFALCSDAEGQPYAMLEAMRAGCPAVVVSRPGLAELVEDGRTGRIVEAVPADIAAAIDELLANTAQRLAMGANARARFWRHHALDDQVSRLGQTYSVLLEEHDGRLDRGKAALRAG